MTFFKVIYKSVERVLVSKVVVKLEPQWNYNTAKIRIFCCCTRLKSRLTDVRVTDCWVTVFHGVSDKFYSLLSHYRNRTPSSSNKRIKLNCQSDIFQSDRCVGESYICKMQK